MRQFCSKVIVENFFEPCVLFLLLQKPGYGYELKQALDEKCSCKANIGNLYRCLARLKKSKYVTQKKSESALGPSRIVYEITPAGRTHLAGWMAELEAEAAKITTLITNYKKYESHHSK